MPEIHIKDISQLKHAAKSFCDLLKDNKIFAFYGEMGAGKTTFIKELCKAIGVKDEVSSPTFTIVNEYSADSISPIYHFDFYRIESINEIYEIGFSEYINYGALILMEWAEKIEEILPENCIKANIKILEDNSRVISWE